MADVCISGDFTAAANILDIAPHATWAIVLDQATFAASNGSFTTERPLPGTNHHDYTIAWTNSTGRTMTVVVAATCDGLHIAAPQPNLVLMRARMTTGIPAAPDPDTGEVYDSEFGGGFDLSDQDPESTPEAGILHRRTAAFVITSAEIDVPPGQQLQTRYRVTSHTPAPWSPGANNGASDHYALAGPVVIQYFAAPKGA